ncbi:uncharacterized protein LOC21405220 [Morus notabilis]|uniref:uncharacterized protein LOC21405220 n=1 Tax=Morus notabilis TaxID=981085 RepID=UPI000CECF971|nr:uncharacterized protein LOC21405220 [Morus notabilis]
MMRYLRKNLALFPYHLAEYVCRVMRISPFRYYCDMIFEKIMWKLNKSIAKELLPTQPVDFAIEPWWGVCLVNFTLEEFKRLSEEEMATMDKVCKEEANSYILFVPDIIKGLYRWGLISRDLFPTGSSHMKILLRSCYMQYLLFQVRIQLLLSSQQLYRLTFHSCRPLHLLHVDWDGQ